MNSPKAGARTGCLSVLLALSLCAAPVSSQALQDDPAGSLRSSVDRSDAAGRLAAIPLFFVENRGRYPSEVRFYVEHQSGALLFRDTTIVFRDHGREDIVLGFPGSDPAVTVSPESRSPTLIHYLVGKEEAWQTDVPTYHRLRYAGPWPGIDLVVLGARGGVKYEFQVAPGGDPGRIRMQFYGPRLALAGDGGLELRDEEGLRWTDAPPVSLQDTDRGTMQIDSRFLVDPEVLNCVRFQVGPCDRSKTLVIDPALLVYSGYLPPAVGASAIVVDARGAVVVSGEHAKSLLEREACLARVRPDGTGFEFITYLGSAQSRVVGAGVATDASGIYWAGGTTADEKNFPVKVGPDLTFNNPGQNRLDGFVCKLAHDGKTIIYCGYVGGSDYDGLGFIAVDSRGAAWLAGVTLSSDYPVLGGPQLKMPPGYMPGCVTKVAPDGKSLILSGYLGGSSPFGNGMAGLEVDAAGNGYVAGYTTSDARVYGFPVKGGPSTIYGGGGSDAFVAKIDGNSGSLIYCGFIGGWDAENAFGLALDASGAAYVTGWTYSDPTKGSPGFPVMGGPFTQFTQMAPIIQPADGYVAKVAPDGKSLVYSGFLGGFPCRALAVDSRGRAIVAGGVRGNWIAKLPYPMQGALSPLPTSSADQGVLLRVSADGKTIDYADHFGGAQWDNIYQVALGPRDTIHIAGPTGSDLTFPRKIGPNFTYNKPTWLSGGGGYFIAKIAEASITPSGTGKIGTTVTFNLSANDDPGLPYLAGTSFGKGPIPLGSRTFGLGLDPLLQVSISGAWPTIFRNYVGLIGANGTAAASINIPNQAGLIGLRLHTAFLTFDALYPLGIKSISDTATVSVTK